MAAPNDRSPKDWHPGVRVLKTKAKDNHGYEYGVVLQPGDSKMFPGELVLAVGNTPGRWYMSTLMEKGLLHNEIYIDYGQGWKIINFGDVMREAVTLI